MDITLVYFIYGLAFFSMGLAMLLESGRSPLLAEAAVLLPLAVFGFVHGGHEWLEMFLEGEPGFSLRELDLARLAAGHHPADFVRRSDGLRLAHAPAGEPKGDRRVNYWLVALVSYSLLIFLVNTLAWSNQSDRITHIDASLRYLLAVPAAALAGVALLRQASSARGEGNPRLSFSFTGAAVGFLVYAATQLSRAAGGRFSR